MGNIAKPTTLSPRTTNPLLHTVTAKPVANQLLQKEGTTPRPTIEHPEQPNNTRLNTVPGPQERTCPPPLKTD
ncbi:hypothetical protein E2C01_094970 [Portunus trituberculatus]|uniref:Uncharacterized protein n=1 Tax=Portunus trituberculatus TaxID=210409 RepID=A0A5B7JXK3_PORTR|nr:hypothetical protein [Portunus trituberculatus]